MLDPQCSTSVHAVSPQSAVASKRCNRCGAVYPLTAFPNNPASRDGKYSLCRPCRAASSRAYRDARREHESARSRAYYRKNREHILSRNAAWAARNPDRMAQLCRAANVRCRGARHSAQGHCTTEAFLARWEYYGGRCWVCGGEATDIDHVIPLSRGGTSWPANLRPACRKCNARRRYEEPAIVVGAPTMQR